MLEWKLVGDSWYGNGYRIDRVAPYVWQLEEVAATGDQEQVSVRTEPIATLPTLAACQQKAEMLHETRRRALLRQRLTMVGIGGWSVAMLATNPFMFVAAGFIGSAALLELTMTWFEGRVGGARELRQ